MLHLAWREHVQNSLRASNPTRLPTPTTHTRFSIISSRVDCESKVYSLWGNFNARVPGGCFPRWLWQLRSQLKYSSNAFPISHVSDNEMKTVYFWIPPSTRGDRSVTIRAVPNQCGGFKPPNSQIPRWRYVSAFSAFVYLFANAGEIYFCPTRKGNILGARSMRICICRS